MVRYAIDHNIQQAEELQNFDYDGYSLNHELTHSDTWVFCRDWFEGLSAYIVIWDELGESFAQNHKIVKTVKTVSC